MSTSDSDLIELVTRSLTVLESAAVPEDLRVLAFEKVFDLLAQDSVRTPSVRASASAGSPLEQPPQSVGAGTLDRIASRLGISYEAAESVYFQDGEKLELVVPPSKLNPKKSRG